MIKAKTLKAKKYYNELNFEIAKKVGKLVTTNKKLEDTSTQTYIAAGIALYPALYGSCSHYTSCKTLCIGFTGIGNTSKGSKNDNLSNIDMAMLKRLWLLKNESEYFYNRAKNELEQISDFGIKKVLFREITSEIINYGFFESISYVHTYGYFKNPEKVNKTYKTFNMPKFGIYSWSELSKAENVEDCNKNNLPIAVVVPKKLFKKFFNDKNTDFNIMGKIAFHNGDKTDMNSHWNLRADKLNIHLLSEKTARYSNVVTRPKFLDSYKKLFQVLAFYTDSSYCQKFLVNA